MANLRILSDNAADRASIAASSSAGAMLPASLQNDMKSDVWRSTTVSATLTLTWPTPETISAVALCYANLSSQAQIKIRGFANVADAVPILDSGYVFGCPPPSLEQFAWGRAPLGVNAYVYGGSIAQAWLVAPVTVQKLTIEILDTTNPAGYVEAGRIVAGDYWSPERSADLGASINIVDASKHYRTDAGDLLTDVATRHRKQSITLSMMRSPDRTRLWEILWGGGIARPVFFSLFPDSGDAALEQTHSMFCKLSVTPVMSTPFFNRSTAPLELEEV